MGELENKSPLPGINSDEYTKLLLSVGGTSKDRRCLSPVEVGELLIKSKRAGATTKELTAGMNMTDSSMPGKFMKLAKLDETALHLVTWGATDKKALGFSVATQAARIEPSEQPFFVEKCLVHGITKDEAMSVVQLFQRSGQPLDECFERVVARRPIIKTLEVILGSVASDSRVLSVLESMTQLERDQLFRRVVNHVYPEALNYSAKLGKNRFTIIGGKSVGRLISSDKLFSEKLNESLKTFIYKDRK